ncbi:hypothetical protein [Xanthobacter autotrophicus]|uniref:hypothetical protein n=1 Tax=Xanthobacter autotrophicus TaxID=280 RepID=UPI00372A905F
MDEGKFSPKTLKALVRAKETLEKVGETEVAWKPLFADALLDLFAAQAVIAAEDVTRWLERELEKPSPKLRDIDMTIETRRIALRAAMRHLAESVAKRDGK